MMEFFTFFIIAWLVLLIPGFDDSVPPTGDKTFKIEYSENVQSIKTISDETLDFWGLEINLKQNSTDVLEVKIPKNFPIPASFTDTWHSDERGGFVLVDKMQIAYEMVNDPCYFHYKIPVEGKTNVEITYGVILTGTWQLYSPRQFDENDPCYDKVFYEPPILSPLKQFKSGVDPYYVICRQDLELVIKLKNNFPACVKLTSLKRLLEQGWIDAHDNNGKYTRLGDDIDTKTISVEKSQQIIITNNDSTIGQTLNKALLTINKVTIHSGNIENLPAKKGFITLVFDYSVKNTDNHSYSAHFLFAGFARDDIYPYQLIGGEFDTALLPHETRSSYVAIQVVNDARDVTLVIKDPMTQKIIWKVPVDLRLFLQ